MARIKIMTRGKTNPSPLYVRFTKGREFDYFIKTGALLNPAHWDNTTGKYRNVKDVTNRIVRNARFYKLKLSPIERNNDSFMLKRIDRDWLEKTISDLLNSPEQKTKDKV